MKEDLWREKQRRETVPSNEEKESWRKPERKEVKRKEKNYYKT